MTLRELDERDRKLIAILQDNARTPITELARQLNLSRNAVQQRLNRMEREGRIVGYTLVLGENLAPRLIRAIVFVQMSEASQDCHRFASEVKGWPEIRSCNSVAGVEDLCIEVEADSTEKLSVILLRLSKLDRVKHISSHIILETVFER